MLYPGFCHAYSVPSPWALDGSPRWGLASPLQHGRSKVSNLAYLVLQFSSRASLLLLIRRVLKPSKSSPASYVPRGRPLRDIRQQTEGRQSAPRGIAVRPLRDIPHGAHSREGAFFPYSSSKGLDSSRPSSVLSRGTRTGLAEASKRKRPPPRSWEAVAIQ